MVTSSSGATATFGLSFHVTSGAPLQIRPASSGVRFFDLVPSLPPDDVLVLDLHHDGRAFVFSELTRVDVSGDGPYVFASLPALEIQGIGDTLVAALDALAAAFAAVWDHLASERDANLTVDARRMKRALHKTVKHVRRVP
jgi:hypothetical protein